jgi:hypothetical protein
MLLTGTGHSSDQTNAMTTPMVSIVMSVFNGATFLSQAIASILDQSFGDFEFLIIDDGSNDGSASILASYQEDSRVRIYHQENKGLIQSLNRGCELARGKYIARMDADDIATRDRLQLQVKFMEEHPEVSVVGGAVEFIDASGKVLITARYPVNDTEIKRALLDGNALWHPTVLFRKETFDSVGGYRNIADAEDYDLWLRIADRFQLVNLATVVLKYRIHPAQGSVLRFRKQALGTLAARTSAILRRSGKPDPLNSIEEITPTVLGVMGVSETNLQTTMARGSLSCIRNMCRLGEYSLALDMLKILHSFEFGRAESWVIADSHLWAARMYWSKAKFIKSLFSVGRAVVIRPIILGRPFRALGRWLRQCFKLT